MAEILDGVALAKRIKDDIKKEIVQKNLEVGLAVVLVGNDPASRIYVNNKKKDCEECGISSVEYIFSESASQEEVIALIQRLNSDKQINGILIQQPFPSHIDVFTVNESVSPLKDVDAFRADTVGRIAVGSYGFLPCTPAGVMELIHSTGVPVAGKECVVVGRSNIVGKPMALMLLNESATVTICHSRTRDLGDVTRRADILVSAAGRAGLITAEMVKKGAIVIDVGMNRDKNGRLCGDVDFEGASKKADYITPVPGGVGPMTRALLMKNTLTAKSLQS
ncbi:MAG: bifunctional 5,10-methylenetetrahydrofolate dehydrogenase/5,10-methenyltetrahydrofolate cyclohydrolase [Oscillospiraceae bacterium]|nr:bifunctional 5,10-methylenetetrahydrofolate dehydrogenase/5,10-methenyltetrahydrofolate cyclohydrolase [Oscillospiraceae bacterium]